MNETEIEIAEDAAETALAPVDAAVFEQVDDTPTGLAVPGRTRTPWVGFFGSKTKTGRDALVAAGVEQNQFYLHDAEPLKLRPFEFHLLKSKRYFSKANAAGKIVAVRTDYSREGWAAGYREQQVCLVAVIQRLPVGGINLIPAIMTVRSGLADALKVPIQTASGSAKDKQTWAARSTNHAIAANAVWAGGRFVVTAWGSGVELDDGNEFNKGHSSIRPSKPEEVAAFNKLAQEQYAEKLAPAFAAWQKRCEGLEKIGDGQK